MSIDALVDLEMPASYTPGMLDVMTSTRKINRLVSQAQQLEPAERVLLIRELIGEDGLYGAAEAAERLGVAQPNLRPIPGLPSPVEKLRSGSVWLGLEVNEFARNRAPKVAAA